MGRKRKKRQGRTTTRGRTKNTQTPAAGSGHASQTKNRIHRLTTLQIELIGVVVGILLTVLFTGILGPDPFAGVRRYVVKEWRSHFTSQWDLLVSDYIEQTINADIWMEPPAMYAESEEYFRSHPWGELDPQVPHKIPEDPIEVSPIEELVPESRTYAGRMVGTAGVTRRRPTKWNAMPNLPEWVIQIQTAKPGHKYETVYCRVTTAADVSFKEGDIVAAYGLILGAGHVKQADGPGILDVAYMACSAVKRIPDPKSSAGDQAKG